jgi:AraC-like DNA-binding protein
LGYSSNHRYEEVEMTSATTTRVGQFGKGAWTLEPCGGPDDVRLVLAGGASISVCTSVGRHDVPEDSVVVLSAALSATVLIPGGGHAIVLTVPGVRIDHSSAPGLVIDVARDKVSGMLAHVVRGLAADHAAGFGAPTRRVSEHLAGMVTAMCIDEIRSNAFDLNAVYQAALESIDRRLWDLDVHSAGIAGELCVSTRTLHRAFRAAGTTVGSWIRDRRLERCRDDLADPGLRHLAVSAIGARWGLPDAAHFSRLFKAKYGASPRAYRAQATSIPTLARATMAQSHVA